MVLNYFSGHKSNIIMIYDDIYYDVIIFLSYYDNSYDIHVPLQCETNTI